MPIIPQPYIQYGGVWTTSQATDAVASGTWAVPPTPKLFSWGQNSAGQLGLGNTTNYSSPKQVGSLTNWLSISAGYSATLAVKTNGTLWGWGNNAVGQSVPGTGGTYYSSPKQVGALTTWASTAGGFYFSMALKTDGTLWSWGYNSTGQLGLGNTTSYSDSPHQVGNLTNWAQISCGSSSTGAIKTDNTLWMWGNGSYGALGFGNSTNYSSPKQVGSLTDWAFVAAGSGFTFAVKTNGTLWSIGGYNADGRLGQGNTTALSSPKQVGALTNWMQVTLGNTFVIAIKTDGTLWSWGSNVYGQLGLGNTTNYSSPIQVGSLTNWSKISASDYASYIINNSGNLYAWGRNNSGQLGLGNTTNYSSPKQVGALSSWTTLMSTGYAGSPYMLAIAATT